MQNAESKNAEPENAKVEPTEPGIIARLGELGPAAIISESGLAELFHKHPASIRRATEERGEFPRPVRIMGQRCWTCRALVEHIEKRLADEAKEAERTAAKVQELRP